MSGFHASTAAEYAARFAKILNLNDDEKIEMRLLARKNARRFSEAVFTREWVWYMGQLIELFKKQN